jgi:recombinational DNA repair protein RecR
LITELSKLPGVGNRTAQRLAFHILRASGEDALGLAEAIKEVKEKVGLCEVCFNLADEPRCRICQDPRRDATVICVVEEPSDVIPMERTHEFHGLYHVLGGALSPIDGIEPEDLKIQELYARVAPRGEHASTEVEALKEGSSQVRGSQEGSSQEGSLQEGSLQEGSSQEGSSQVRGSRAGSLQESGSQVVGSQEVGSQDGLEEDGDVRAKGPLARARAEGVFGDPSTAPVREVVLATNPTTTGEATALHIAEELRYRAPQLTVTRLASGLPVGSDLEYADEVTLGKALAGRRSL